MARRDVPSVAPRILYGTVARLNDLDLAECPCRPGAGSLRSAGVSVVQISSPRFRVVDALFSGASEARNLDRDDWGTLVLGRTEFRILAENAGPLYLLAICSEIIVGHVSDSDRPRLRIVGAKGVFISSNATLLVLVALALVSILGYVGWGADLSHGPRFHSDRSGENRSWGIVKS